MNKKCFRWIAVGLIAASGASCTTAYDAYGRPQTVVDPGVALLGAAAVGVAAYALANNDECDRHYRGRPRHTYYRSGGGGGHGRGW